MPSTDKLLPLVKPGDKLLASTENDLRRQLNALSNAGTDVHAIANAAGKFIGASKARLPKLYVAFIGETAIPARSSATPGSGRAQIFRFDSDDALTPVTKPDGTAVQYDIFNVSNEESPTNSYILVIEEAETGKLIAVIGGGAGDDTGSGFPPGTGGCDCGHCFAGITIHDALECCTSHLRWSLVNPWLSCVDTDLTLEYIDNDTWLTEAFLGPDCDDSATTLQNEYRWKLTIDIDGLSYLTLVEETDNGCDPVCIIYGRDSFECQCDNEFSLLKPYGTFIGVERDELSCYACLKPLSSTGEPVEVCSQLLPLQWQVNFPTSPTSGACTTGCDAISGTYSMTTIDRDSLSGLNLWGGGDSVIIGPLEQINDCDNDAYEGSYWIEMGALTGPFVGFSTPQSKIWIVIHKISGLNWSLATYEASCQTEYIAGEPITFSLLYTNQHAGGTPTCNDWPDEITATPLDGSLGDSAPTSNGVCSESCTPTATPTDPDAGACCLDGTCYDRWDEALCTSFGGDWNAAGCGDCEDTAPCCVAGVCIDVSPHGCVNLLGGSLASGSCDSDPCAEGACCASTTGACAITTAADCPSPNYWWGADTDCDPDPCPGVGACCESSTGGLLCGGGGGGATCLPCFLEVEGECGGQYAGDDTHCGDYSDCDCVGGQCDNGS